MWRHPTTAALGKTGVTCDMACDHSGCTCPAIRLRIEQRPSPTIMSNTEISQINGIKPKKFLQDGEELNVKSMTR